MNTITMAASPFIDKRLDMGSIATALVEWAAYPVAAWTKDGRILIWNGGMAALTGWDADGLEDENIYSLLCQDDKAAGSMARVTNQVLSGSYPRETDVCMRVQRKDGRDLIVACRPFPLLKNSGGPIGVAAVFQDLDKIGRPIVARALDPSSGVAVDQELGTLVFRIDAGSGRLFFVNNLMSDLLGYSQQELIEDQRLLPSRILPDYDESFGSAVESAVRGVARSVEVGFVHRDGGEVFCVATLYPLKGAGGRVVAVEAVGRDITGRKQAESRLERSLQQLREAYSRLQVQHEDLKSVERLKSQIIANVSHELRTPLVTIRGYNDLMRQGVLGDLTDGQRKGLDISARSIQRLLVLIENLLDYARIERRGLSPLRETFNLVDTVRAATDDIREDAMRKNLSLDVILPVEPMFVRGDAKRMRQVFLNLLDNATKFSQVSGRVTVKCSMTAKNEGCVEVRDEGIGIPESELRRIFDSFYQVDGSTTRSYPGAGIGLAVAKEVVERHNGRIEVESREGKGTSFKVFVPLEQNIEATTTTEPALVIESESP